MVYYIGHGVEFKGNLNVVLLNGANGRLKYNLEAKTNQLAKSRLVHVMFDCNRLHWKNENQSTDEVVKKV